MSISLNHSLKISIRAPREGSDVTPDACAPVPTISIRAPREGSDGILIIVSSITKKFQSALPVRGATQNQIAMNFNREISIRAPREGSDGVRCKMVLHLGHFNPRSP